MSIKVFHRIALACALASGASACADQGSGWRPADPEFQTFISDALPVLLRDCAFHTCHGSTDRFFRVWGPGRARLDPTTREFDKLTVDEWQASYQLAASMVDARNPNNSLLLRKPLAIAAGGSAHRGADMFGRNVYRSTSDDGYVALQRWVLARKASNGASK